MQPLNLNQAAKTCKKSKSALLNAIRSGRLSAKQNELKVWEIDPSELFRVYPFEMEIYQSTSKPTNQQNRYLPSSYQLENRHLPAENITIEKILELERAERNREREQMQSTIDDLRKRLDEEAEERRKLTKLLTHQPEPITQKKENLLFQKIFGKKS